MGAGHRGPPGFPRLQQVAVTRSRATGRNADMLSPTSQFGSSWGQGRPCAARHWTSAVLPSPPAASRDSSGSAQSRSAGAGGRIAWATQGLCQGWNPALWFERKSSAPTATLDGSQPPTTPTSGNLTAQEHCVHMCTYISLNLSWVWWGRGRQIPARLVYTESVGPAMAIERDPVSK